jgi:hypothetical protein
MTFGGMVRSELWLAGWFTQNDGRRGGFAQNDGWRDAGAWARKEGTMNRAPTCATGMRRVPELGRVWKRSSGNWGQGESFLLWASLGFPEGVRISAVSHRLPGFAGFPGLYRNVACESCTRQPPIPVSVVQTPLPKGV